MTFHQIRTDHKKKKKKYICIYINLETKAKHEYDSCNHAEYIRSKIICETGPKMRCQVSLSSSSHAMGFRTVKICIQPHKVKAADRAHTFVQLHHWAFEVGQVAMHRVESRVFEDVEATSLTAVWPVAVTEASVELEWRQDWVGTDSNPRDHFTILHVDLFAL